MKRLIVVFVLAIETLLMSGLANGEEGGGQVSSCPNTLDGDQTYAGPWLWRRVDQVTAVLLNPYGNEYARSSFRDLESGEVSMGVGSNQKAQLQEWARCHLALRRGDPGARKQASNPLPLKSQKIQGCPAALPNSCISWIETDEYFHWWEIKNRCNRAVIVTYRDNADASGRAQTNWIHPGSSEVVVIKRRPPFGVWDAREGQLLVQRVSGRKASSDAYSACKQSLSLGG